MAKRRGRCRMCSDDLVIDGVKTMARACAHWLELERCMGRSGLLKESILYLPMYGMLRNQYGGAAECSFPHSAINTTQTTTPFRLDFWVKEPVIAIEAKWAEGRSGTTTKDVSAWLHDVDRLRTAHGADQACRCFFVLAGEAKSIGVAMAAKRKDGPKGEKGGKQSKRVDALWFREAEGWYKLECLEFAMGVCVRCVCPTPDGAPDTSYVVRAWEVRSPSASAEVARVEANGVRS